MKAPIVDEVALDSAQPVVSARDAQAGAATAALKGALNIQSDQLAQLFNSVSAPARTQVNILA